MIRLEFLSPNRRFGKSPVKCYVEPKLAAREHFEILHSCCPVPHGFETKAKTKPSWFRLSWSPQHSFLIAIQVRYCTSHFREKNMDVMPPDVLQVGIEFLRAWSLGVTGTFSFVAFVSVSRRVSFEQAAFSSRFTKKTLRIHNLSRDPFFGRLPPLLSSAQLLLGSSKSFVKEILQGQRRQSRSCLYFVFGNLKVWSSQVELAPRIDFGACNKLWLYLWQHFLKICLGFSCNQQEWLLRQA